MSDNESGNNDQKSVHKCNFSGFVFFHQGFGKFVGKNRQKAGNERDGYKNGK